MGWVEKAHQRIHRKEHALRLFELYRYSFELYPNEPG